MSVSSFGRWHVRKVIESIESPVRTINLTQSHKAMIPFKAISLDLV
jgi:hypothetical protein